MNANDFIYSQEKVVRLHVGRHVYSSGIVNSDIYYCFVTFKAKPRRRYLNNGSQLRFNHLFVRNIHFRFI